MQCGRSYNDFKVEIIELEAKWSKSLFRVAPNCQKNLWVQTCARWQGRAHLLWDL